MINENLRIFVKSYQDNKDKSHIVKKFSYFFLCGFLYYSTFILIISVLFPELTERLDTTTKINCITVSKPQGATATPCTTPTIKHPIAFVDDYSKRGLKVERRVGVESQRNASVLRFEVESLYKKSHFGESLKTKMLIKQALIRDA